MKHRGAVIAGIVAVALVALVALFASGLGGNGGDNPEQDAGSGVVGNVAPALKGTTTSGEPFDLDKLRGQWVLVNFFATWCPPCVQEHPELVKFSEGHRGEASVVSVAYDDTPQKIQEFFAANGGDWPVLASDTGASVEYGVVKLPESFLVDPDGKVVRKLAGGVTAEQLDRLIASGGGQAGS